MSNCPICGKPVDALRAPAVSVREGRVVSYCSKDCAALAESGPARLIPTKIVRVPSNSELLTNERRAVVTPASGVVAAPAPGGAPDSGPVIEVSRDPSRPVASARHKRADSSSVQVADTGRVDDFVTHEPRGRGVMIAVALVLLVLGAGVAAYFLYFAPRIPAVDELVMPRDAGAAVVVPDAGPTPVTREQALARAQEVLRKHLTAPPRVQRVAAKALARTGDADAREILAQALGDEESDLANIELAYALARSGDPRGLEALVAAASPTKRESKHEAGGRLAQLGDKRAIKILGSSLVYPQFRIGVAERLAFLADPRAIEILDGVLTDPKSLPDAKARAAIGLAWAGRTDVVPMLRQLLADDRENKYASAALAHLHDEAARPVLEKQLAVPSLRVHAARSLRLLAPDADISPLLPPLVDALTSEKDTEQIPIAEALLLLAGPPAWSEHE